ncbi:hypothetical protein [Calothrix sp. 336/3]|uniref:hypothetical protein n=1 Tax=Calothrix sp. 336/3 TaxID=1337936 RepID=UPI0004E3F046|nr:hypothetical protein [Calothrix sp. 336/3]AKG24925.1 hypothetical protein IJ00_26670 [Calothrix sp. 336/3]
MLDIAGYPACEEERFSLALCPQHQYTRCPYFREMDATWMTEPDTNIAANYDEPWKMALETYFEEAVAFFLTEAHGTSFSTKSCSTSSAMPKLASALSKNSSISGIYARSRGAVVGLQIRLSAGNRMR